MKTEYPVLGLENAESTKDGRPLQLDLMSFGYPLSNVFFLLLYLELRRIDHYFKFSFKNYMTFHILVYKNKMIQIP